LCSQNGTRPIPQNGTRPIPQNGTRPIPQNGTRPIPQNGTCSIPHLAFKKGLLLQYISKLRAKLRAVHILTLKCTFFLSSAHFCVYIHMNTRTYIHVYVCIYVFICTYRRLQVGLAQNLEIISKKIQFSTRPTRILLTFIISTMLLCGTNRKSHRQNSGFLKSFQNNLKIQCHPICNRPYIYIYLYTYIHVYMYTYIQINSYTYMNIYVTICIYRRSSSARRCPLCRAEVTLLVQDPHFTQLLSKCPPPMNAVQVYIYIHMMQVYIYIYTHEFIYMYVYVM